jgi:hypothetical protein
MAYSFSKLGGKYLKADIEKTDKVYHRELKGLFKRLQCDCGNSHCNWATLRRGAERFVCIHCAQKLRADSNNKIKSCMGTYLWHPDEMAAIRRQYKTMASPSSKANEDEAVEKQERAAEEKDDPFGFFADVL